MLIDLFLWAYGTPAIGLVLWSGIFTMYREVTET